MRLVRHDEIDRARYEDYIAEWESSGATVVPGASERKGRSFEEMQATWRYDETEATFKDGFVPSTLYFLEDGDRRIVGAIHFRHLLNDKLRLHGGHIGYGVRASERRKGHAAAMLGMLLEIARAEGCTRVMLTCDESNAASQGTIEKLGGLLEDKLLFEGKWTRRYWIEL
jgi:predicted acetyltransferase